MPQIRLRYKELFSLRIEQLFYNNKRTRDSKGIARPDIEIVPHPYCLTLFKKLNYIIKKDGDQSGITVMALLAGKNGSGHDLLRFIPDKEEKLTFVLILKNPDLLNCADIDLMQLKNQIYYFNNKISNPAAERNQLTISQNTQQVDNNDLMNVSGSHYEYHTPGIVNADHLMLKHIASGKKLVPFQISTIEGNSHIYFNLQSSAPGIYELEIEGAIKEQFYFTGYNYNSPVFGMVEIFLSDSLNTNYRVVENDHSITAERPQYIIRFKNRKTTWRYTFLIRQTSPVYQEIKGLSVTGKENFLNSIKIVSNNTGVRFKQRSATEKEIILTSEDPIGLQEDYTSTSGDGFLRLSLAKNAGKPNQQILLDNIPYPSARLIDARDINHIYSDVFLTI